jgi:hypothetical protein
MAILRKIRNPAEVPMPEYSVYRELSKKLLLENSIDCIEIKNFTKDKLLELLF